MEEYESYDVVIIGTGPAGLQAAIHASRRKVSVIVLGKERKSSLFNAHVENMCCLFNSTGKEMLETGCRQAEISGDDSVKGLILEDGTTLTTSGVFIELGAKGLMELATTLGVALDDDMRFIQTDKGQQTSVPGIFTAGDICRPPWRVAKAVGEGCVAGLNAADYAKKRKATNG